MNDIQKKSMPSFTNWNLNNHNADHEHIDFLVTVVDGFCFSHEEAALFLGDVRNREEKVEVFCSNAKHLNNGNYPTVTQVFRHFLGAEYEGYKARLSLLIIYSATSTDLERAKAQRILDNCPSFCQPGQDSFTGMIIVRHMHTCGLKMHKDEPTENHADSHPRADPVAMETVPANLGLKAKIVDGFLVTDYYKEKVTKYKNIDWKGPVAEHEKKHSVADWIRRLRACEKAT